MQTIVTEKKKSSARVRFLMQDVVELRLNNWKKRREEAGPKTIEQIHKDAEREKLQKEYANTMPVNNRQDQGRRGDDNRKKSSRGGTGGGGGQGGGDDGWTNVPSRPARAAFERVDTSKLKNITKVNADDIQLGPPGAKGPGFSSWGRGSQTTAKTSRQENDGQMQNRLLYFPYMLLACVELFNFSSP